MTGLLLVVVLGQRLALPLPGPQVQLTLVAVLAALGLLVLADGVRADIARLQLYLVAALAVVAVSAVTTWSANPLSIPSLVVLLILWLPWVFRLRHPSGEAYRRLARRFVRLMLVLAPLGVVQVLVQVVGLWRYADVMQAVLPTAVLIDGYNTSIPFQYGSSLYKANAFVFLEPSFFSQYCALAMLLGLLLRAPLWQMLILGLGLVVAVSGTGLVMLGVGAVLLLLRRPGALLRPAVVVPAVLGTAALLASPVAQLLLDRRDEITDSGSSANSRFVAPYLEVGAGLAADPVRYLVGAGPGTATRMLESSARGQLGDAIVYNILAKLLFEYGLIAGALFTLFILVALLLRCPVTVIPGSLVLMLFFLSGSLLQPHTVVLAWLFTGLWAGVGRIRLDDGRAA